MKNKYHIVINYKGELHNKYTYAYSKASALNHAVARVALDLRINKYVIRNHVNNGLDNYKVRRIR